MAQWRVTPKTAAYYGINKEYAAANEWVGKSDFNNYDYIASNGEWLGEISWGGTKRPFDAQVMYVLGTRPDGQPRRSSKAKGFTTLNAAKSWIESNVAPTGSPHLYPKGTKNEYTKDTKATDLEPIPVEDAQRFAKRPKEAGPGDRIARCVRCNEPLSMKVPGKTTGIMVAQGVVHEGCASSAEIEKYMKFDDPRIGTGKIGPHHYREYMREARDAEFHKARLHRALDAVMDSRGAAKDAGETWKELIQKHFKLSDEQFYKMPGAELDKLAGQLQMAGVVPKPKGRGLHHPFTK